MSSEEFKCVFCKESFDDKETLQVHFRKHGDKNFHLNKGRSHDELSVFTDKAASNKDPVEMVECDVCPEVFTSISKAITHKHKAHPDHDAKYFCPWCGKLFTMKDQLESPLKKIVNEVGKNKHLYNKHINTSHSQDEQTDKTFHCDACDVDFMVPVAVMYHNKFFHRVHEMSSIGSSKKLKMISQEAVPMFYCPFCGEEYDNKVNLHKHMADDHSDENQHPDDVLRCPVCDAIFFHLDAYELHLTYHSINDMYSERTEIMDEITDFSLETVPPMAERVENMEPQDDEAAIGIEQLFEQSMDDTKHKKKKHKKHKKSKSAITLDQFLTMNTDVFGEGLDFQGVEEVPSQIIAKRFKRPNKKQPQSKLPPDIEKLKRQGIVIKKKTSTPTVRPLLVKTNKIINQTANPPPQKKPLATPNDVLTKLINQNNSQIKIVKKSSLEVKSTNDITSEKPVVNPNVDDKIPTENKEPENELTTPDSKENDVDTEENKIDGLGTNDDAYPKTTGKSPKVQSPKCSETNDEEASNHSQSILDGIEEKAIIPQTEKSTIVADKLAALRNNSNIVIKSPNQSSAPISNKKEETINDADENMSNHEEETDHDINGDSNINDSLNALKHLSHLIVKSSSQDKKTTPKETDKVQGNDKKIDQSELNKIAHLIRNTPVQQVNTTVKNSTVTVPTSNTPLKAKAAISEDSHFDTEDEIDEHIDETVPELIQSNKLANILNNPHLNIQTIKKSPKVVSPKESPTENLPKNEKSSVDLLKHLKNVTAKPIGVNKIVNSSPKLSPKLVNTVKIEPMSPPIKLNKGIQEDIEIFNIDDSDSDEANSSSTPTNKPDNKETTSVLNKPTDVLKNINKNITIKSVNNHNPVTMGIDQEQVKEFDSDCDDNDNEQICRSPLPTNSRNHKPNTQPGPQINQKQSALNNVLKNLSKNITVKSGNASPAHFAINQDQNSPDSPHIEHEEEDAEGDIDSGRVKIMEMKNDDEEFNSEHVDAPQDNVKVQYPDDSNSDNEGNRNEEFDDHFSDEDTDNTTNAVKMNSNLDSLKNVCKDLVIKPSGQSVNQTMNRSAHCSSSDEIPPFAKSLSNQISIKNTRQGDNCNTQIKANNSNPRNADHVIGRPMNKSAINQKMASSSHQVNTVNKEVKTVKTFQTQTQTKTVIQEITTTVTKTIKTVNQSMKQEVTNTGQSSTIPKKIQHVNANNRSFQGIKVRQTAPMAGPRIRNPGMRPTRPAMVGPVRASNQLVPVRPRFSAPRQITPRMPNIRPYTSGQVRHQIGTQVKVAPGVFPTTSKRPNNESPGHFSCFKKPKESLFPDADFSAMNKQEGDSVQFSSAMQMSKSNFACTTKTVKGNNVVTSTQMKSEMSASSQQLGKLRNLSGLSVVKTSQASQSQVEEKSEINTAKQNTLDAIQKLQSQGLLVKKPRVASESEHSNPGSDDMEHFSDGS